MTLDISHLTPNSYRAISIDAPWMMKLGTRGRPQHYNRMTDAAIAQLPLKSLAHPDGCWVFVWALSAKTHHLFPVAAGWGAKFSSRAFIWVKMKRRFSKTGMPFFHVQDDLHLGMGFTTRKNAEDCWLFKFGSPKRKSKSIFEIIYAPVREHSRKPDQSYERIEQFCDGPYCEIFGRQSRPGWDIAGDQATLFDEWKPKSELIPQRLMEASGATL